MKLKHVHDAIEAFKKHCSHLSEATRRKHRNVFRHLQGFADSRSIGVIGEFTLEHLDEFRAGRGIQSNTAIKELQTLRQFFAFCLDRKWTGENIAKRIRQPANVKPTPVEPYTQADVARIFGACDRFGRTSYERLRARAMVLLLRCTGVRISDVSTLAKDRVRDGKLLLRTQKTGGTVYLPIPPELLRALEQLPIPRGARANCPYFFWNGTTTTRAILGIAERSLGAVFRPAGAPRAHADRFRHTLATDILVKGGTEQDVADVLGIGAHIVRKHYAKWTIQRQERISSLMQMVQTGTFAAQSKTESAIN
ncbi:MAG: tyrosine-type recombinase/integrase [Acidobacteriota bacterium]